MTAIERHRGWYEMYCFNALSRDQQYFLVHEGYLPIGYEPQGECSNGAEVEITTMHDLMPGPRFYCIECGAEHLRTFNAEEEWADYNDDGPVPGQAGGID